jgi:hypothetical protein
MPTEKTVHDEEIDLLALIISRLPKLDASARRRVIEYAERLHRDGLSKENANEPAPRPPFRGLRDELVKNVGEPGISESERSR